MKLSHKRKFYVTLTVIFAAMLATPVFGRASSATKIQMLDNTNDGIGPTDPVIGFVVFNQDGTGRLIIEVSLKRAVASALLEVQLVIVGTNVDGGITPEPGGHYGLINILGNIATNVQGNGNAHFFVNVTTLFGTVTGVTNYGHIDVEDDSGAVNPSILDYGLVGNQYGATPLQWQQP